MNADGIRDGNQDFAAAIEEIDGNTNVRRLMFVVVHVLLPGGVMAAADCVSGADYPPELAWLPRHILTLLGGFLAVVGAVVTVVLSRCHFGMVVNATKMRCVLEGVPGFVGLNWLGITTNFVLLSALSSGAGLALCLVGFTPWIVCLLGGLGFTVVLLLALVVNHRRANKLSKSLVDRWEKAPVSDSLREEHAKRSLSAVNADIAIIVTMAAALFVGFFAAMSNLGAIPDDLVLDVAVASVKRYGVTICAVYLVVSLALSSRMIVRLRLAIAQHSATLAQLRHEPDAPWRFRVLERTFLLYLVVLVLAGASAVILVWPFAGGLVAAAVAVGLAILAILRYIFSLGRDRRRSATQA